MSLNVHVSEMSCLWNVHVSEMSCLFNVHVSEMSCLWNDLSLKCPCLWNFHVSEMSMSEMSNTFSAVIPKNILPLGSRGITSLADIISMLRLSCLKIISSLKIIWLIRELFSDYVRKRSYECLRCWCLSNCFSKRSSKLF